MKKTIITIGVMALLGVTAYAQTQKTNRTKTKSHDRTDTIQGDSTSQKTQTDKADHETDMDRNNPNTNVPPPKATDTKPPK